MGYNRCVLKKDINQQQIWEKTMKGLTDYVLAPLTFIGAINWGLVGIFGFDLVAWLFGPATLVSNIVYAVIGVAAVVWLILMFVTQPTK